jgi:hypothetical protein
MKRWIILMSAIVMLTLPAAADPATPGNRRPGRITCTVVRDYVALVGIDAAEKMARATGASDARIEAGRRCLRASRLIQ